MPNTDNPTISGWVGYLAQQVGSPDENTYLVGHSMGCQAIIRYLETINRNVGGILLVAGFVSIRSGALNTDAERNTAMPWVSTPIDWAKAKANTANSVFVISDNDPYIDISDAKVLKERLGAKVIVIPGAGHFTAADGYMELHLALNEVMKMAHGD
jgi:predicted alpha/beta hydrolase family esterase